MQMLKSFNDQVYANHLKNSSVASWLFAVGVTFFLVLLWLVYLTPMIDNAFDGTLMDTTIIDGEEIAQPTGYGMLLGVWYFFAFFALITTAIMSIHKTLRLIEIKRSLEYSWFVTLNGLIHYDKNGWKDHYNTYAITTAVFFTVLLTPCVFLFTQPFETGTKMLVLYLVTFVGSSTYGLRHTTLQRINKWTDEKQQKKTEQKEGKKRTKANKNDSAQSWLVDMTLYLQNLPPEYKLGHFEEQVQKIIQEVRVFTQKVSTIQLEEHHLLIRIIKEEVPAVLITYDELDATAKEELHEELEACLEKIVEQVKSINTGQKNMRKLGAKKVIELINSRY